MRDGLIQHTIVLEIKLKHWQHTDCLPIRESVQLQSALLRFESHMVAQRLVAAVLHRLWAAQLLVQTEIGLQPICGGTHLAQSVVREQEYIELLEGDLEFKTNTDI